SLLRRESRNGSWRLRLGLTGICALVGRTVRSSSHLPSDLGNAGETLLGRIAFRPRVPSAYSLTIGLGQSPALILARRTETACSLLRTLIRARTTVSFLGHL